MIYHRCYFYFYLNLFAGEFGANNRAGRAYMFKLFSDCWPAQFKLFWGRVQCNAPERHLQALHLLR
jgi:hypothetical protein